MRTRYEICSENRRLKRSLVISRIVIAVLGVATAVLVHNAIMEEIDARISDGYEFGYQTGFDACIQENNLYDRYQALRGDESWAN